MTVLLAGGGETEALRPLVNRFLDRVVARAAGHRPRVALIVAATTPKPVVIEMERLLGGRAEIVALLAELDASDTGTVVSGFDGGELLNADGVLITDGHVTGLLAALEHRAGDVRRLVHDGVPFFGIGAGAAIAADRALAGGHEIGGVAVAPVLTTEPDAEVTFEPGLGLVDLAIVPHAASHGRIGLAVAAIEAGLIDRALAIDTDTAIEVGEQGLDLIGAGSVWQLTGTDSGVVVSTMRHTA